MDVTKIEEPDPEPTAAHGHETPQEAAKDMAATALSDLGELVDAHPVATVLAALGIGYAVGGGIFTSLTRRLLGTGVRLGMQLAVLPALESQIADLASDLGKSLHGGRDAETSPPHEEDSEA
jgi:hypothetical protein